MRITIPILAMFACEAEQTPRHEIQGDPCESSSTASTSESETTSSTGDVSTEGETSTGNADGDEPSASSDGSSTGDDGGSTGEADPYCGYPVAVSITVPHAMPIAIGDIEGGEAARQLCVLEAAVAGHTHPVNVCRREQMPEAEQRGELSMLSAGATMWLRPDFQPLETTCGNWTWDPSSPADGEWAEWDGLALIYHLDGDTTTLDDNLSCASLRSILCCTVPCESW